MTAICVYNNINSSVHLIADSLSTGFSPYQQKKLAFQNEKLSTGLLIDFSEHVVYEDSLKIGIPQDNLAIGIAGNKNAGNDLLLILKELSPFSKFCDFKTAFLNHVIPSVTPCVGGIEVCGFMIEGDRYIKFIYDQTNQFLSSSDPMQIYFCGSGGALWDSIINRTLWDEEELDPSIEFISIAQDLYIKEFIGIKRNISEYKTGGAISGVYSDKNKIKWQKNHTILIFVRPNKSKDTFIRLPIVHKTNYLKDNLISTACVENNEGNFVEMIKFYSNSLSEPILLDKTNLPIETMSFESDILTCILLPYGFTNRYPSLLSFKKKKNIENFKFFDEIFENRKPKGFRVSEHLLRHFDQMVSFKKDFSLNLKPYNNKFFEAIGFLGFNRRGYYIRFECGEEWRLFYCIEGYLYKRKFMEKKSKSIAYFKMKGIFVSESKTIPPSYTIRIIDIPLAYVNLIELGPLIKSYNDPPYDIPSLLIFPDFPKAKNSYSIEEAKNIIKELVPGKYWPNENISNLKDPKNKLLLFKYL